MKGRSVKIAIIDSGYSAYGDAVAENQIIGGTSVICGTTGPYDYSDEFGHGSAVAELIAAKVPEAELYIVKAVGKSGRGRSDDMIKALEYVEQNVSCDIVHMSAGVRACTNMKRLIEVVDRIVGRKTVIVSAFDNAGALSYPASLKNVIGVDVSAALSKKGTYEFIEGNVVDFRVADIHYRINWQGQRIIERGTSFACTEITAEVARMMSVQGFGRTKAELLKQMKERAARIIEKVSYEQLADSDEMARTIQKAIAFPFNKEMFSLAANENLLRFENIEYYDARLSIYVGRKISEILPYSGNDKTVLSIEDLDWNADFDTLILGHLDEYEKMKEGYGREIIRKCEEHGKRIFSFGNITSYYDVKSEFANRVAFPYVDMSDFPQNRFHKLRQGSRPVLMVCGTSAKQGKFSLQLMLKRELQKRNYKVFHISTEPQGALLGADRTFPTGYSSTVYTDNTKNVPIVNEMLFEAEQNGADIILSGLQSQSAPVAYFNMRYLPIHQFDMLYGLNPDAVVLVVNCNDDIRYIQKTRLFIENATRAKVLALAMLPTAIKMGKSEFSLKRQTVPEDELEKCKVTLKEASGLNVFTIGSEEELTNLTNQVIKFFAR